MAADIARISPGTEVLLRQMDLADPWDFQEVYGALFDFARDYGFDEDRERYHVHLTTGTHVAQICWFLLARSRHVPARLLQTGPPREGDPNGTLDVIDLDLSRYDALQQRFDLASLEHAALLKGGIATRNPAFNAVIDRIEQVATTTDAPLLLLGGSGTGKTELAQRIYELKLQRRRLKDGWCMSIAARSGASRRWRRSSAIAAGCWAARDPSVAVCCARRMGARCSSTRWTNSASTNRR